MKRLRLILGFIIGVVLIAQSSWGTMAYVTDSFEITLRTGPSLERRIIAMPASGQPLEVLRAEGDWSYVRMVKPQGDSLEGWVLTRYLKDNLPWKVQAENLGAELASVKERMVHIEKELNEVKSREKGLVQELKERREALQKIKADYDSLKHRAADYLKVEAAYQENRSTLETAQADVQKLTEEVGKLRSSERTRWLLTGALVLLIGLIIGLVIGRQQKRHRSSLYS
jgi:SH3 domain protein